MYSVLAEALMFSLAVGLLAYRMGQKEAVNEASTSFNVRDEHKIVNNIPTVSNIDSVTRSAAPYLEMGTYMEDIGIHSVTGKLNDHTARNLVVHNSDLAMAYNLKGGVISREMVERARNRERATHEGTFANTFYKAAAGRVANTHAPSMKVAESAMI